MGKRKLLNGSEVPENDTPIDLIVHTKAPSKWKLIDMETGQKYIGSPEITQYGHWIRESNNDQDSSQLEYKDSYREFIDIVGDELL